MIGSWYEAGCPLIRRCERVAGAPQTLQIDVSFVTNSDFVSRIGIVPNGSPRKSLSNPATITRIPRSARYSTTSTTFSSKNCLGLF